MLSDNHVVGNLNQVVGFNTFFNPGLAERGTINTVIGTDLNMVVNLNDPGLWNFNGG